MKINYTKLPKVQRFACSRKDFKAVFENTELEWVGFAYPSKSFSIDSRYRHVPIFKGYIVADITIGYNPTRSYACLYPVRRDEYPENAIIDFHEIVLPKLAAWHSMQIAVPETHNTGLYKSLIVEWRGDSHLLHELYC